MTIKEYTAQWKEDIKSRITKETVLAIVQVGDNEASNRYVRNKIKDCEEVGMIARLYKMEDTVSEEAMIETLKEIQKNCDGVMVQLPLPKHLDVNRISKWILPSQDVDGFLPDSQFVPCTPLGILMYLESEKFQFDGANVLVIGRSEIVGRPLAKELLARNATVTLAHSHTRDLWDYIPKMDLVVSAVGRAKFLDCSNINCKVVDVGINFENGKLVGDCYHTEGKDVTPVPGGVGLLTRCALLENVLLAQKNKESR